MSHEHHVLVLAEESDDRVRYAGVLGDAGLYGEAVSPAEGRLRLEAGTRPCVVIIDEDLGRLSWAEVHRLCGDGRSVPVVLVARQETALEPARHLRFHVLPAPLEPLALRRLVTTACAATRRATLTPAEVPAPAWR